MNKKALLLFLSFCFYQPNAKAEPLKDRLTRSAAVGSAFFAGGVITCLISKSFINSYDKRLKLLKYLKEEHSSKKYSEEFNEEFIMSDEAKEIALRVGLRFVWGDIVGSGSTNIRKLKCKRFFALFCYGMGIATSCCLGLMVLTDFT